MRWAWIATYTLVLAWSAIAPQDRLTWVLEVTPALAALSFALEAVKRSSEERCRVWRLSHIFVPQQDYGGV